MFDWDKTCISSHLLTDLSEQEREDYLLGDWDEAGDYIPDLSFTAQKLCKSTTSLHSFKTAFGDFPLTAGNRYFFQIRCIKGSNFKIGVAEASQRVDPDIAFSDTELGWGYYSNG